jgi:signal transduction histidine kinase
MSSAIHLDSASTTITPAQREAEVSLAALLRNERARAERMQNLLRAVILIGLGAATVMYAPSLPVTLQRANLAVLVPMLVWSLSLVVIGRSYNHDRLDAYPRWLSVVAPIVDVSAVTAIILCYGIIGTPSVALKAPIIFSYFAILAARPMIGSARSAAIVGAVIVVEYALTIVCLALITPLDLTLDPLVAATSANVSVLDEVMKVMLLGASGIVAYYATAWHQRVLHRALTSQVARDAEARALTTHLQEADKLAALGTLAASIAHDVNSPLTTIALTAELLARSASDDYTREEAQIIASQAHATADVVRDLLAFARNDAALREPIALDQLVTHAVKMLHPMLREHGVTVEHDHAPDLPYFDAGAASLERVIVNIVINAAQAMQGQPEPRMVRVSTTHDAEHIWLTIEDTGPGFPDDAAEHLFERFFTTKPMGKGTGLGLWMAAQVIEAHGGTISATNTRHGARFTMMFPLARTYAAA